MSDKDISDDVARRVDSMTIGEALAKDITFAPVDEVTRARIKRRRDAERAALRGNERFTADDIENSVWIVMRDAIAELAPAQRAERYWGLEIAEANDAIFRGAIYALADVIWATSNKTPEARQALAAFVAKEIPALIAHWETTRAEKTP